MFLSLLLFLRLAAASPRGTKPLDDLHGPITGSPTNAPQALRRQHVIQDNICGYASGSSSSSVTCDNPAAICATNTFFGVHGCCDPLSLSACTIPTACIASTAMSTLCTNNACSSDLAITKCTASGLGECNKWLFVYESTTMTQHGCAETGFTSTALRSSGQTIRTSLPDMMTTGENLITAAIFTAPNPADIRISTYTQTQTAYIVTRLPESSGGSTTNLGAIIGGAVGGFAALSATGFGIFFVRRKLRKDKKREASVAVAVSQPDETAGKDGVVYRQEKQTELPGQPVVEMSHPPIELDGVSLRQEASASPTEIRRPHDEGGASL